MRGFLLAGTVCLSLTGVAHAEDENGWYIVEKAGSCIALRNAPLTTIPTSEKSSWNTPDDLLSSAMKIGFDLKGKETAPDGGMVIAVLFDTATRKEYTVGMVKGDLRCQVVSYALENTK